MKRMTTLKEKYESIIDEYVKRFEKKHDLQLEFWVADDKTGVASFGDVYCFNVEDIIYDINNKLPKGLVINWLEDGIDYYEKKGQTINIHSYANGLRYQDLPDAVEFEELESIFQKLKENLHYSSGNCKGFVYLSQIEEVIDDIKGNSTKVR
jgi:hypothetical protein